MATIRSTETAATRVSSRRRVIPDRVKARRVELDLTQEQLAERAGISPRTLGAIEAGTILEPWSRTLYRLAAGLGYRQDIEPICVPVAGGDE